MISENEQGAVILALHRATHATLRALAGRLADLDLAASEASALAIMADGATRSVSELAHDTATRPTTLTSLLDRLAGRGYVVRELDPDDRRSFRVLLTDAGRPAADAARAAIAGLERQSLAGISDAELAGFLAVARALTAVP